MSHRILGNGDLIAFEVNRKGFVGCPPQHEPIPEYNEKITQLRVAEFGDENVGEEAMQRQLPCDFTTRCVFRIECELPSALVYGSRVRLIHDSSDCKVVASGIVDNGVMFDDIAATPKKKRTTNEATFANTLNAVFEAEKNNRTHMHCGFLRKSSKKFKDSEDIWVISSRYKLREEGESIYATDEVMLLSVAFGYAPLGYNFRSGNQGFIGTVMRSSLRYSFKVYQLCPAILTQNRVKSVLSGDYVRLVHQELGGLMICRLNDEKLMKSAISPLGKVIKMQIRPKDETHQAYIRNEASTSQFSGDSIWQIIRQDPLYFGNLTINDTVTLRHLLSGQFLCLVQKRRKDLIDSPWVVSTCEVPSEDCRFVMRSLDKEDESPEIDTLGGSIRFGQNISFLHLNSDLSFSVEHYDTTGVAKKGDLYRDDFDLLAANNRTSRTEVYKLRMVPPSQVQDTLFIARMLPIAQAAAVNLQLCRTDMLHLPLFRHLSACIEVLIRWLAELAEAEFSLLENIKSTFIEESKYEYMSSLVAWLGRPTPTFKPADFDYNDLKSREICGSALLLPPNKFRQNLLADSGFLEALFNLNNIAFSLSKIRQSLGSLPQDEQAQYNLPTVVGNICLMIHDIFHISSNRNSKVALRLIASKGALRNLLSHESVMWHPPISIILNAAIEHGDPYHLQIVEASLSDLNAYDVRLFIRQMDTLRKEGREAGHILDLMDTLARYGTPKMIKRFQDFIVDETFDAVKLPSYGNHVDEEDPKNVSVFFCSKFNKTTEKWEVALSDASFELRSGKPSRDIFMDQFDAEYFAIKRLFEYYDADKSGSIDFQEMFIMLEELGLGGIALLDEAEHLQDVSLLDVIKWWWEKRNVYFSAYSATLNEITYKDIEDLLSSDMTSSKSESKKGDDSPLGLGMSVSFWGKKGSTDAALAVSTTGGGGTAGNGKFSAKEVEEYVFAQMNQRIRSFEVQLRARAVEAEEVRKKNILRNSTQFSFLHPSLFSANKGVGQLPWVAIRDLLAQDSSDTAWFRRSLQLFCQLGSGNNITSQMVINKLLPADCLMRILNDSENVKDKGLICQLICNLFVYHDFVFPVAAIAPSQACYFSVDEISNTAKSVTMGKLFNVNTVYSTRAEPFIMRVKLKKFILAEIDQFTLVLDSGILEDVATYQYSLLSLVKGLLSIGFFEEDFSSYEVDNTIEVSDSFGTEYLVKLLLAKLKELYADFGDVESIKTGIRKTLEIQLKNGDISETDLASLELRIEKANGENLGVELAITVNKYFSVRFGQKSVINVINSIVDVIFVLFEYDQLTALKQILAPLNSFEAIYPELTKATDITLVDTNAFIPRFDKKLVKSRYAGDDKKEIEEADVLMNTFYFDDKALRGKLLSYMQKRLFRTDITKYIENLAYFVSREESTGKRLFDTINTSIRKYVGEFELAEHDVYRSSIVLETLGCLFNLSRDIVTNRHHKVKAVLARRKSAIAEFFSFKQKSNLSPLEVEESDYFLDEFDDFFPPEVLSYTTHLSALSVELLRSIGRLVLVLDEDDEFSFRLVDALPAQTLKYIILVLDFLALLAPANMETFALAWIPFDKVIQHLLGVTESAYRVMEVIYQYHPELETLVTEELIDFMKAALDRSFQEPKTWPPRLLRAILLNLNQDSMYYYAKTAVNEFFTNPSNDRVVALDTNATHSSAIMQMNAYILQLLETTRDLVFDPIVESTSRALFHVTYIVNFLECRRFFLVSKSILLRLHTMRDTPLDPLVAESSYVILSKIYRFTEFCEGDNVELLDKRWKKSFYYFSINGLCRVLNAHLKSFTRDIENKLQSLVDGSRQRRRSSLADMRASLSASMSFNKEPVVKVAPSLRIYQSLGLIIDILMSCHAMLWNSLSKDKDSLQLLVWISVAAKHMLSSSSAAKEAILKNKLDSFLAQVSSAYEATLIKTFRETFLGSVGIKKYLWTIAAYLERRRSDTKKISTVNVTNDYEVFVRSTRYSFPISEKVLRKSSYFHFVVNSFTPICRYLQMGGVVTEEVEEGADQEAATSAISPQFEGMTDFELWRSSGGRLYELIADFLCTYNYEPYAKGKCETNVWKEDVSLAPAAFMVVLCTVLQFRTSSDESIKLSVKDKNKLYTLQDAFNAFGVRVMVTKLLNRAMKSSFNRPFFDVIPLVLRLGAMMMAEGNKETQDAFMKSIKGTNAGFAAPLRHILRECCHAFGTFQKDVFRKANIRLLKLSTEVMGFIRSFCGAHNKAARLFLRNQDTLGSKLDLVFDVSEVIIVVGNVLSESYIRYIDFEFFKEKLAPLVWESSAEKRRFIAWHDKEVNYLEMLQLVSVLGYGFRLLKDVVQGPCYENQQPALKVAGLILPLLEYCGVMHLKSVTKLSSKGATGTSFRIVRFEAGNPPKFLKAYKEELIRHGKLHEEPIWKGSQDSTIDIESDGDIGVHIDLLWKVSKEVELNALQYSLALLEGTSDFVVRDISSRLEFALLFQNMDNDFNNAKQGMFSFTSTKTAEYIYLRKEAAIAYLSLISTLFSATARSTLMLTSWVENCRRKGLDIKSFNASVEIIGQKGDIQQIFFTIPPYISSYWPYPEVQRVKDIIVVENDRDSPEEKINSFRKNIDLILSVMARQRQLAILLSPYIHAIFGGKPVAPSWVLFFVPRQRAFLLFLCLFLNIYYAYLTYRDRFPGYPGFEQYFNVLYEEINKEYNGLVPDSPTFTILDIAQWLHFTLNCSIFFRQILNSRAADELYEEEEDDGEERVVSETAKLATAVYKKIYGIILVFFAEWWALAVCALSFGAIMFSNWLYVPILLEIIPQFPLMIFLVTAIKSNIGKIGFSILLALLILYFYSVIAYLFVPDQYAFNGHTECADLISCFKNHIDYGLNNPPQWLGTSFIKPDLPGPLSPSTNAFGYLISSILGSLYSISFVIIINLVLTAIISGVIIDTFSSMREKEENIQADIKSSCFICSIPRDEFESNGIDYRVHIKDEHNMWKYVWLKVYLNEKDPLLYTGPEHYAFQQMQDKQTFLKLFPVKKSLSLSRMKARAKASEASLDLAAVFAVIQSLDSAQKDLKRALTDVKRVQENQIGASDNLQQKFARLQLLNSQALDETLTIKAQGDSFKQSQSSALLELAVDEEEVEEEELEESEYGAGDDPEEGGDDDDANI